MSALVRSELR